jgi:hypothetical protein
MKLLSLGFRSCELKEPKYHRPSKGIFYGLQGYIALNIIAIAMKCARLLQAKKWRLRNKIAIVLTT